MLKPVYKWEKEVETRKGRVIVLEGCSAISILPAAVIRRPVFEWIKHCRRVKNVKKVMQSFTLVCLLFYILIILSYIK